MDIRILWRYKDSQIIIILDIGHHLFWISYSGLYPLQFMSQWIYSVLLQLSIPEGMGK